ncbi:MAG: hypothetical protein ABJC12_09140 [Saprospiraceae bacterium]
MKNLLISIMVIFGLTSCSKDSFDQSIDQLIQPGKSEIKVSVSYLHWTDQCESSCSNIGVESLSFVANARVELYQGENSETDATTSPISNLKTGENGTVLLENIEPDTYTVWVDTPLGKKSRIVTTQLHKRSYIDFSF